MWRKTLLDEIEISQAIFRIFELPMAWNKELFVLLKILK